MTAVGTGLKWRRLAIELTKRVARGNYEAEGLGWQDDDGMWAANLLHALLTMFAYAAHEFLGPTGLLTTGARLMALDADPDAKPNERLAARLILHYGWVADAANPTDGDGDWHTIGVEEFNASIEGAMQADGTVRDGWNALVAVPRVWFELLPFLRTGEGLSLLARWAADEPGGHSS
jgi:hypothetical protein